MKIKTETSRENGFKETEIGLIPKDWDVGKLGDCIDAKKGRKPETLIDNPEDGFEPYLTAGYFRTGNIKQFVDVEKEKNSIIVDKEDVVLIWDGSNAGDVFTGLRGVLASTMVKITPKNHLTKEHLYYFLKTKFDILNEKTTGSTIPHVSKSIFENLPLPLPLEFEQQKISSVLSKIQQAIEQQDKIIQITKELKKSLMNKLFTEGLHGEEQKETEIGLIPKSWEVIELGNLCEHKKDSIVPNGEGNKYVGLEHITSGETWIKSFGYDNEVKSSKFKFDEDDILYGKLRPYLDKAATANFSGICSTDIIVLTPNEKTMQYFVVYLLHLNKFIEYAKATTSGVNHPRTSWSSLKKFKVALPKLSEQKEIANILSNIDKKLTQSETRKQTLQSLFKTMLNQLMTGRVRVKNLDIEVN